MKGLTEKQKSILDFIEEFSDKEGMAPTVYEIADHFKIKTSTVFAHIRALQRKNELTRSSKARSIALTRTKKKSKHLSSMLPIPLLGQAGAEAQADSETREGDLFVDPQLLGGVDASDLFALRICGESMRDLGIFEGDIVIAKKVADFKAGDIVVAQVNDEMTVKCYYPLKGSRIELRPANPEFLPQVYPNAQVKLQGVVIALQREY
jgi:repressor LexA